MGADIGLTIGIGGDNSDAQQAVQELQASLGNFAKSLRPLSEESARATKPFDDALLNQHQSVHLLLEDFGVHLPRSVAGAIAEMTPELTAFGGVFLGAFALKELPDAIDKMKEFALEMEGFGNAARTEMEQAIKDTASLAKQVGDVEKQLEEFGKTQAEQLAMRAQWASEDADNALKPLLAAEQKVRDIQAKIDEAKKGANIFAAGAGSAYEGALKVAQAEVGKLREAWKKADEEALLAQKRAAQAAALEEKKKVDEAQKAAADANNAWLHYQGDWMKLFQNWDAFVIGLQKAAMAEAGQVDTMIDRYHPLVQTIDTIIDRNLQLVDSTIHLNAVRRIEIEIMQALHQAGEHEAKATMRDQLAATESLASGFASLIGGQRAAAAVSAVFDAAKGAEQIAMALDPLDPNHAMHWISAGQFFVSSAEFAKVAGTGTHHSRAGVSGGGRGSYSGGGFERGGGGGPDRALPQTLAPGAAVPGGELHVHILGSNDEALHWFADMVTNATQAGHTVIASSSQRGSPVGH